jgi:hypothetical protein
VTVSATSGLADGQAVTVHVVPTGGSQIFRVEARMCKAGAVIDFDADFRPAQTGNCGQAAVSQRGRCLKAAAARPYQSVDMTYRVGVGERQLHHPERHAGADHLRTGQPPACSR